MYKFNLEIIVDSQDITLTIESLSNILKEKGYKTQVVRDITGGKVALHVKPTKIDQEEKDRFTDLLNDGEF